MSKQLVTVAMLAAALPLPAAAQTVTAGAYRTASVGRLELTALPWLFTARADDAGGVPRTIEGIDDIAALTLAAQYGISEHLDGEMALTATEDVLAVRAGLGVEVTPVRLVALCLRVGAHADWFLTDFYARSAERFTVWGLDASALASVRPHARLDLYAGLRLAYERPVASAEFLGASFTRLSVVPGVSFAVTESTRVIGEAGIKLDDQALGYVGLGLAWQTGAASTSNE